MMYKPDDKIKRLYEQMAELTNSQCLKDCKIRMGFCCSPEYCEMAQTIAKEVGVELKETRDANGVCLVPPYLRPLCTLHICERSLMDLPFAEKYFKLREKIDLHEEELYYKSKNNK